MLNFFANLVTTASNNKENAGNNNKREHITLGLKDANRSKDAVKRDDKGELTLNQQTFKSLQACLSVSSAPLAVKKVLAPAPMGRAPEADVALLCANIESNCAVADQQGARVFETSGAQLVHCEVAPPLGRGDSELSASATPPTIAQPTRDAVHVHVPVVDLQRAVLEQTPLTEDEEGPKGDVDSVDAHPYVKAPAAQDDEQDVMPADFEGQDASESETAGLVDALDALVLGTGEEETDAEAEAPETIEAGVDRVLEGVEKEEAEAEEEEEQEVSPPASVEDADYRIQEVLEKLKGDGVPVMDKGRIKFGAVLGKGAFGTVKLAQVAFDHDRTECAVKTIVAEGDEFNEKLTAFETEARVSWLAARGARKMKDRERSRVCRTLAVAYSVCLVPVKPKKKKCKAKEEAEAGEYEVAEEFEEKGEDAEGESSTEDRPAPDADASSADEDDANGNTGDAREDTSPKPDEAPACTIKGRLHLIMEKLESRGDLHKEVTSERWWDAIRTNGEDTGARLRANYTMTDDDGDVFAFSMPRRLKLHLAEEFARGVLELRRCDIVHCDIKPCNVMLVNVPHAKAGKAATPGLKIIDFGEGNTSDEALGFVAGTPGYQAPEVVTDGECSFASDIYSTGVSLIEMWVGDMWDGAETRGEGYEGMRGEVLSALAKIQKADPKVAAILCRCIAEKPERRPSARQLLKALKAARAQPSKLIALRGRGWAANKA